MSKRQLKKTKSAKQIQNTASARSKKILFLVLFAISAAVIIAYIPSFNAQFTNWDDYSYVVKNRIIKDLKPENIKAIFTVNHDGNYHPLTMLSLAINFKIGGMNPFVFHFTNILFHLLNSILLFFLINNLFRNYKHSFLLAFFTSILFGVNAMHIESVTWISERKDVLYSFFFLLSMLSYIKYIDSRGISHLLLSLLFFVCSALSKGQAVSLSICIIIIDLIRSRKILNTPIIIEKIPYLIISVVFGIIAIKYQRGSIELSKVQDFDFYYRIFFAGHNFWQYPFKLLLPLNLSSYYEYPDKLTLIYLVSPVITLALFTVVYIFRKNKFILYGSLFYAGNIIFLLQLLPVGNAIMADRYSYIPTIGVSWIIAYLFILPFEIKNSRKVLMITMFSLYAVFMIFLTFQRNKVWHDSISLWNDVISKCPTLSVAYNNRGTAKEEKGDIDGALSDFSAAIEYNSAHYNALNNRGRTYDYLNNPAAAEDDFKRAVSVKPDFHEAYYNYGNMLGKNRRFAEAISKYDSAILFWPFDEKYFSNRAIAKAIIGKTNEALADYNKAIELNPTSPDAYFNRSALYLNLGRKDEGCADLMKAMELGHKDAIVRFNEACKS